MSAMKYDTAFMAAFTVLAFVPALIVACSADQKAAEQKILNAADVVCAIDAFDPGLVPAEIDAAIQKACGASADIHKIVDAQSRSLARHKMALVTPLPPSCPSAQVTPAASSAPPIASAAPAASSAPTKKK